MTITSDALRVVVQDRRKQVKDFEERNLEAIRLDAEIQRRRKNRTRHEHRQKVLAALGDKQPDLPQKSLHPQAPQLGLIEWEPVRSRLTGRELAAAAKVNVDHLKAEIKRRE